MKSVETIKNNSEPQSTDAQVTEVAPEKKKRPPRSVGVTLDDVTRLRTLLWFRKFLSIAGCKVSEIEKNYYIEVDGSAYTLYASGRRDPSINLISIDKGVPLDNASARPFTGLSEIYRGPEGTKLWEVLKGDIEICEKVVNDFYIDEFGKDGLDNCSFQDKVDLVKDSLLYTEQRPDNYDPIAYSASDKDSFTIGLTALFSDELKQAGLFAAPIEAKIKFVKELPCSEAGMAEKKFLSPLKLDGQSWNKLFNHYYLEKERAAGLSDASTDNRLEFYHSLPVIPELNQVKFSSNTANSINFLYTFKLQTSFLNEETSHPILENYKNGQKIGLDVLVLALAWRQVAYSQKQNKLEADYLFYGAALVLIEKMPEIARELRKFFVKDIQEMRKNGGPSLSLSGVIDSVMARDKELSDNRKAP